MSEASASPKAYVRLFKPSDLTSVAVLQRKAFIHDPLFNYFASLKTFLSNDIDSPERCDLEKFFKFLYSVAIRCGARITVVAVPEPNGESVYGSTIWLPPNKRITLARIWAVLRSGGYSAMKAWGFEGIKHIMDYGDNEEATYKEAYKLKGIKKSPNKSWYLLLAGTDPAAQSKGYLSLLIREAFSYSPKDIFTLDASTTNSRDRYAHLGFELFKPIQHGVHKCDENGIVATGQNAKGITTYCMIKWQ